MAAYEVITKDWHYRPLYTDDLLEAMDLFEGFARQGLAVWISSKHMGNDRPSDTYDEIMCANV